MRLKWIYTIISVLVEASYLYPLYVLMAVGFKATPQNLLSFEGMLFVAISAGLINVLISYRSMRLITVGLLNIFGIMVTFMVTSRLLHLSTSTVDWINLLTFSNFSIWYYLQAWLLVLFSVWLFARSALIAVQDESFDHSTHRFEISMGVLFAVFLIAAVLPVDLKPSLIAFPVCLILNIGALIFTKNRDIHLRLWVRLVAVFGAFSLITALLVKMIIPYLAVGSQMIYNLTSPVFMKFMGTIFIFLARKAHLVPDSTYSTPDVNTTPSNSPSGDNLFSGLNPQLLHLLLTFFEWVGILLAVVLLTSLVIYFLLRWLRTKRPAVQIEKLPYSSFKEFILYSVRQLIKLVRHIKYRLWPYLPISLSVNQAYRYLLYWGNIKHLPRHQYETPYEYCKRLGEAYPGKLNDLETITASYVAAKYGPSIKSTGSRPEVQASLRQLFLKIK